MLYHILELVTNSEIDVSLNNAYATIQDEWEDIKDISNIPSVSILTFVAGIDASYINKKISWPSSYNY